MISPPPIRAQSPHSEQPRKEKKSFVSRERETKCQNVSFSIFLRAARRETDGGGCMQCGKKKRSLARAINNKRMRLRGRSIEGLCKSTHSKVGDAESTAIVANTCKNYCVMGRVRQFRIDLITLRLAIFNRDLTSSRNPPENIAESNKKRENFHLQNERKKTFK